MKPIQTTDVGLAPTGGAFPVAGNRTLVISALASMAVFLDTTALFVAFPDIVASFPSVKPSGLSWVLNAYTIAFAALLIPAGKVADRVGHKRALLAGSVLFTLASVACGLAPNPEVLIGFRVLQAVGAALQIPSSLALILRAFPAERIPVAVAIWGATAALAGAVGPTLGAALVEVAGWRWVFFLNVPIGLAIAIAGPRVLQESHDPTSLLPAPLGTVLMAVSVGLMSLAVVQSDDWGIGDNRTIWAMGAGLVCLGIFIAHQRVTKAPTLDLELFAIRNFAWGNAATFIYGIAFSSMFFGSILFLTDAWGWSILRAGFGVAPGPVFVAILAPRAGRRAAEVGQRSLLIPGGLIFALGGLWRLAFMGSESNYWVEYFPSMMLTGTGVALILPQLSSVVAQSLPSNRLGVGGATNQALRQVGGTFGVAVTIALLGSSATSEASTFDDVWVLLVLGGLLTTALSFPLRTARA